MLAPNNSDFDFQRRNQKDLSKASLYEPCLVESSSMMALNSSSSLLDVFSIESRLPNDELSLRNDSRSIDKEGAFETFPPVDFFLGGKGGGGESPNQILLKLRKLGLGNIIAIHQN